MKEVTVQELKKLKESKADFQLIDVREPFEYEIVHIDGELIPMGEIVEQKDKISKDKQVIFHCKSGRRSGNVTQYFEQLGYENVYNLKGGILAYIQEIEPDLPTY